MRNSEKGMTLIEILVSLGILGGAVAALMTFVAYSGNLKTQSDTAAGAVLARDIVIQYLNNPKAWSQTIASNPQMACILNSTDCSGYAASPSSFNLYDGQAQIVAANSGSPSYGFKRNGEVCTSFSSTSGSGDANCVFHYDLTWRAVCAAGCTNPQIEINGNFTFNADAAGLKNSSSLNADRYDFRFIRGSAMETISGQSCSSLGGTPSGPACILPMMGKVCPPGMAVTGIDPANNTMTCDYPKGLQSMPMCLAGQVFKGRDNSGNSICLPMDCTNGKIPPGPRKPPIGWTEEPAGTSYDSWAADGNDGGCDGLDGSCDGGGS